MMTGKPSLVERLVRLSLSQRERTEVRDYLRAVSRPMCNLGKRKFSYSAANAPQTRPRENKKAQRAKHTSDPISPAPGTLLSTALPSGSLRLYLNFIVAQGTRLPRHPKIKEIMNSTRNITNRSFAMPADAAAIPPNPKIAATSAMIRNITAQPNISSPPHRLNRFWRLPRASLHGVEAWTQTNSTSCPSRKHYLLGSSIERH
jgi:hypothetical protein